MEGNEIAYNNTAGFTTGWEAGGLKFVLTNGLIVRGNFSHHNDGTGIHCDIDCINTLIENNRVEDNNWRGIFYEISYKAHDPQQRVPSQRVQAAQRSDRPGRRRRYPCQQ